MSVFIVCYSIIFAKNSKKITMAKKQNPTPFTPPTQEEIMLIQPNNVTFGQYDISEWQENLITLIGDQLQLHMTREKEFDKDIFGLPVVAVMCDEAGGKNNKSKVMQEALQLEIGRAHV